MKKLLLITAIAIAASLTAYAQKQVVKRPPAVPKADVGKPAPTPLVREKFDPLRDPKADLAAAIITASKIGKRIILDVGGEWCGWCVYMDKFFFQNPEIDKLRNDNYVWVKVNMGPENENPAFLSVYPTREGYPHLYVLDSDGKLLHSQGTSPLEAGKGYDLVKFNAFLKKWRPARTAAKS